MWPRWLPRFESWSGKHQTMSGTYGVIPSSSAQVACVLVRWPTSLHWLQSIKVLS